MELLKRQPLPEVPAATLSPQAAGAVTPLAGAPAAIFSPQAAGVNSPSVGKGVIPMIILFSTFPTMDKGRLAESLRAITHVVLEANSEDEALEILSTEKDAIRVFVCCDDRKTPERIAFLQKIKTIKWLPNNIYTIVVIPSGHKSPELSRGISEGVVDDYTYGPLCTHELSMRILNAICRLKNREKAVFDINSMQKLVKKQTRATNKHGSALRATQAEIYSRLFNALEARDHGTASHVQRIGSASAYMGRLLGWTDARVETVGMAALLHDIGKIGIADTILRKPGPLSKEEFKIIKNHTIKGAQILSGSNNKIIKVAETIALCHHEDWNGKGYPHGLKGKDIPMEARVVSVVDVYDALVTDRPYRKALPKEEAFQFIQDNSSVKFDPAIVDLFVKRYPQIRLHFQGH